MLPVFVRYRTNPFIPPIVCRTSYPDKQKMKVHRSTFSPLKPQEDEEVEMMTFYNGYSARMISEW